MTILFVICLFIALGQSQVDQCNTGCYCDCDSQTNQTTNLCNYKCNGICQEIVFPPQLFVYQCNYNTNQCYCGTLEDDQVGPCASTTCATRQPTTAPTEAPTALVVGVEATTDAPTDEPTEAPTDAPTEGVIEAQTAAPTIAPIQCCGDGIVEGDEQCDLGQLNGISSNCTFNCTFPLCGDGMIHLQTEECDDSNLIDGDGCSSTCKYEFFNACPTIQSIAHNLPTCRELLCDNPSIFEGGANMNIYYWIKHYCRCLPEHVLLSQ